MNDNRIMASTTIADNELACLVLKPSSFISFKEYEIQFKQDISCVRTCIDATKDLFDTLIQQCGSFLMMIDMFMDIDYEQRRDKVVIKKTATYHSSKGERFLCSANANHVYRKFMKTVKCCLRQRCSSPNFEIMKVKRIGIALNSLLHYDNSTVTTRTSQGKRKESKVDRPTRKYQKRKSTHVKRSKRNKLMSS